MVVEDQSSPRAGSSQLSTTARQADPYWQPLIDEVKAIARARVDDPELPYRRLGRFELITFIAKGGMGVVFKAHDTELDRVVALKLWNCGDRAASDALITEARCQAKVTHPNVVTIYETGLIGDDVFLAMEFVDGIDGRQWLESRLHRPSWAMSLPFLSQAGAGLAAVHKCDLVHADFKPENLLFGNGQVLVADFGVARVLDEHDRKRGGDGRGTSGRGTKQYMAPERLERRWTDQRSDQFSFCVTLWEFVYGQRPFAGNTVEQLLQSMVVGPRTGDVVIVPPLLHAIMLKGLALDPDDRYASMDELLADLAEVPRDVGQRRRKRVVYGGWLVAMVIGGVGSLAVDRALHSERGDSHAPGEISSESETTIHAEQPGPALETVDKETSEAKQAELEARFDVWDTAIQARSVTGVSDNGQSLIIAQGFYDEAVDLEATDKASAYVAVEYADKISAWVENSGETPMDAAVASSLRRLAAPMLKRLDPQSKHSTVPSTLE